MSQLATKWVYDFGGGASDGDASMKNLLGGKGANLAEMSNLGLPVPPGFTITTEVCTAYYDNGKSFPAELDGQVRTALAGMGKLTGKTFGDVIHISDVVLPKGAKPTIERNFVIANVTAPTGLVAGEDE